MLRLEEKRELAGPDLAPGFEAYNFETVYEEFKSMKREVQMGIHDLPPQVALKVRDSTGVSCCYLGTRKKSLFSTV